MEVIYQKSHVHEVTAGLINTILVVNRATGEFAPATFTEEPISTGNPHVGVAFWNRTNGDMYLWYGAVPPEARTAAAFKARAIPIAARSSYTPAQKQSGVVYVLCEQTGFIHHLHH